MRWLAGWFLNAVYAGLLCAVSPLIVYRAIKQGKYRQGLREKFFGSGDVRTSTSRCVWFHAVSVGEVLLLRQVIAAMRASEPDLEFWISTTTSTGHAVAREKFPKDHVVYFPLDFTWACRRAVARIRPDLVVLAELELWPNFIAAVHAAGVPLAVLNGRMSDRSFRGYSRIAFLVRGWLRRLSIVAAQTEQYADRFQNLGVPAERVVVTGTVKFDGLETCRDNPRTQTLREAFGLRPDELVLIAGSTQSPEEELALKTYESLCSRFPHLRLILVPRHRERFEEVAALALSRGHALLRRSSGGRPANDRPVILLDTLGELSDCWGLADIAFVGGSLTNRGGQNMIEPAAYGAAVLFGPNTSNFRHARDLLLSVDGAQVVRSGDELTEVVSRLIQEPETRRQMGEHAAEIVAAQQGATERTVQLLFKQLRGEEAAIRQAA